MEKTKNIHFKVSERMYAMLKKLCIDKKMSMTKVFTNYLDFLYKKHYRQRELLDEESEDKKFRVETERAKKLR